MGLLGGAFPSEAASWYAAPASSPPPQLAALLPATQTAQAGRRTRVRARRAAPASRPRAPPPRRPSWPSWPWAPRPAPRQGARRPPRTRARSPGRARARTRTPGSRTAPGCSAASCAAPRVRVVTAQPPKLCPRMLPAWPRARKERPCPGSPPPAARAAARVGGRGSPGCRRPGDHLRAVRVVDQLERDLRTPAPPGGRLTLRWATGAAGMLAGDLACHGAAMQLCSYAAMQLCSWRRARTMTAGSDTSL